MDAVLERDTSAGVFVRLPARELAQLRTHAAGLDMPVARLVRMIVHARLEEAHRGGGRLTFITTTTIGGNSNGSG